MPTEQICVQFNELRYAESAAASVVRRTLASFLRGLGTRQGGPQLAA